MSSNESKDDENDIENNLKILTKASEEFIKEFEKLKYELNDIKTQNQTNLNSSNECDEKLRQKIGELGISNQEKNDLQNKFDYLQEQINTKNELIQRCNELILNLTKMIPAKTQAGGDVKSLKPLPTKSINKKTSNPHISNFLNNF
jgi:hypothetical protein